MNKMIKSVLASCAASVLCAGLAVAADRPSSGSGSRTAQKPTTRRQDDRERYAVLTEQNIFVKDRRSLRRNSTTTTQREPTAMDRLRETPEASFVLTGVVFEDGDFRAFIEDTKAGKVLRVSVGEPIARGKITQIDIDTVAYESAGKEVVINVGTTLTGVPYSAFTSTPGATPVAGSAAPSPLPDPNNPNLTIEERMKLRRAAELQKK